ncbi:DUF2142 domain-containing protein [Dactylosporangium roseum]|uniref:DUF2142 domain-containing protein n=1 Tax=Dactylosporangium roseum TaxID=47989 RepID=A0ABY5Z001_9ACTN|nr:DUF2142 domain-containing protein [Dactylosporangium roseum]UWZ35364.1 DUF2142 domain-containing protein [Dactylosporangium roseum]
MKKLLTLVWRRGQWFLAFLGFFLVMSSWSVAAPFDGTMDDRAHIARAAGAAAGEFTGEESGWGLLQSVPAEYTADNCWIHDLAESAACAPPLRPGPKVRFSSTAGRYFPLYYMAVGWPLNTFGGWTGLYLARMISAALSAAFLASAFVVLARRSRFGLPLAGFLVAASPMVIELGGAINPNGLEMTAGIALCAAGVALFLGPRRGADRPLIWLMGISAATLSVLKVTGPLWVAVIMAVLLVPIRLDRLRELLRTRLVRGWLAGLALAVAVSVWWTLYAGATNIVPLSIEQRFSVFQAAQVEMERWVYWDGGYLHQIVGLTSWLDTRMFEPAYPVWWGLAAGLIVPALAFGSRLDRWRLSAMIVGSVGLPFAIQVEQANTLGYVTQARYFMPMMAGIPLIAAFIMERHVLTAAQSRAYTRIAVVALVPIQFVALVFTMQRWQQGRPKHLGLSHLNPFAGDWHPRVGSLSPLLLMLVGLVVVGVLFWRASTRAATGPDELVPDAAPGRDHHDQRLAGSVTVS